MWDGKVNKDCENEIILYWLVILDRRFYFVLAVRNQRGRGGVKCGGFKGT